MAAGTVYLLCGALIGAFLGTWTDEEYSLATTAHGVAYALVRARTYELQAPLYFALLAAWRHVDASVWFARLFSVLCATGFFFACVRIARRIAPELDPLPFALLVSLNPFVVEAAFEIRLYALALLVCALLWLAFDAGFASGDNRRARFAFVILAILGVYVQYFVGFLLLGFAAALLAGGRRRALPAYLVAAFAVGLAALPLALEARTQVASYAVESPPLRSLILITLEHPWTAFLFPYNDEWSVLPNAHRAYAFLLLTCGIAIAAIRPRVGRSGLALVVCALVVELTYVAVVIAVHLELGARYFAALYVPVVAAAYAIARELRRERPAVFTVLVTASALLTAGALVTQYRHLAQAGDWNRVAAYLEPRARRGDAIAVFPADAVLPLRRAYHGHVTLVGFPREPSQETYSYADVSAHSDADVRAAFTRLRPYARVWFVFDGPCDPNDPVYGCEYVARVLPAEARVLATSVFYGSRVEELLPFAHARAAADSSKERAGPHGHI